MRLRDEFLRSRSPLEVAETRPEPLPYPAAVDVRWSCRLQLDLTRDTGDGAATDPDRPLAVLLDVDLAVAAQRGALARRVRRREPPRPQQPLGQRGVEAAGHRVLDDRAAL